ncbi:unnamed protein product, partial [Mesorhabditis belari]|uniref:Neurotransmitter-gated ion-channel ligand-binding domain-containing protein n=1 Tax=Mesorhabditis belari TaxID=2138241 RepID=A0AAF3ENX0_9BILA
MAKIYSNGTTVIFSFYYVEVSCEIEISKFPFDKQQCQIPIMSLTLTDLAQLTAKIENYDDPMVISGNGEWVVTNLSYGEMMYGEMQVLDEYAWIALREIEAWNGAVDLRTLHSQLSNAIKVRLDATTSLDPKLGTQVIMYPPSGLYEWQGMHIRFSTVYSYNLHFCSKFEAPPKKLVLINGLVMRYQKDGASEKIVRAKELIQQWTPNIERIIDETADSNNEVNEITAKLREAGYFPNGDKDYFFSHAVIVQTYYPNWNCEHYGDVSWGRVDGEDAGFVIQKQVNDLCFRLFYFI